MTTNPTETPAERLAATQMSREHRAGSRGDIVVGSRWRSRDRRDDGRIVVVEDAPSGSFGNDFVNVRSPRRSTMRVSTLLTRYDLVITEEAR